MSERCDHGYRPQRSGDGDGTNGSCGVCEDIAELNSQLSAATARASELERELVDANAMIGAQRTDLSALRRQRAAQLTAEADDREDNQQMKPLTQQKLAVMVSMLNRLHGEEPEEYIQVRDYLRRRLDVQDGHDSALAPDEQPSHKRQERQQ